MLGKTISHYKVLEKIGQSRMGEVDLAEDSRLDRRVALKILPQHLSERADLRESLEGEARAVSSLNHPVHIDGAGLGNEVVEDVDVVNFALGNLDKAGNVAAQIQQGVDLDGSLALVKPGPTKDSNTSIQKGGDTMLEENKAAVRRYFDEVWNKGDLFVVVELIASNYVDHDPHNLGVSGPEGIKQLVTKYRTAFPDLCFTIEDMIAEGDKVVPLYGERHIRRHLTYTEACGSDGDSRQPLFWWRPDSRRVGQLGCPGPDATAGRCP